MRLRDEPPDDPYLIAFGNAVHKARRDLLMTQEVFGRAVGLDQGTVSRLERGLVPGMPLRRLMPVLMQIGIIRRR